MSKNEKRSRGEGVEKKQIRLPQYDYSQPGCYFAAVCTRDREPLFRDVVAGATQVASALSRIIQQFKGTMTKRCGRSLWQKSFYDHIIRDENDFVSRWNYIDTTLPAGRKTNTAGDKLCKTIFLSKAQGKTT